jgi:hypothetical protein
MTDALAKLLIESRERLDRHGHYVFGLVHPRIMMQQCRIAIEWILPRIFPLDDY